MNQPIPQRWALGLLAMWLVFTLAPMTHANAATLDDAWAVSPFSLRGVDVQVADVFREILESEIASRAEAPVIRLAGSVEDSAGALAAGAPKGAAVVVYGSMSALGSKILVRAAAVDVASGALRADERMTAERVEDLENIAARLAASLVAGAPVENTAELGTVIEEETTPPLRREGMSSFGFHLGGFIPTNSFADAGVGLQFDLSYVYEARNFAIQPRVGVRFSAEERDESEYINVPIDIGAFYIAGVSDSAFLVGGGLGLRYQREERNRTVVIGDLITQVTDIREEFEGWGFGGFARVGGVFFRTYTVRMTVTADFDVTFVKSIDDQFPMAATLNLGIWL